MTRCFLGGSGTGVVKIFAGESGVNLLDWEGAGKVVGGLLIFAGLETVFVELELAPLEVGFLQGLKADFGLQDPPDTPINGMFHVLPSDFGVV